MSVNMPEFVQPERTSCEQNDQCFCQRADKKELIARIASIAYPLQNFIHHCDTVLSDLNSAYRTEICDAATSNHSLAGFFISNSSYSQNIHVANELDSLAVEASKVNDMLVEKGLFSVFPYATTISTDFNGHSIRQTENAEHNFLANWFTNNAYSSVASAGTANQIMMATTKIQLVKAEARQLLDSINRIRMQF